MRKSRPVVILLSIQLAFTVVIALINPLTNLIIRTFGTEHTFETSEVLYFGNAEDDLIFYCHIKYGFDYNRFEYEYGISERYAVIDTDENGISYVSSLSHEKPESGVYLGSLKHTYPWYDNFEKAVNPKYSDVIFNSDPPVFDGETLEVNPEYKFTVKAHIFRGMSVLDEIYVNGVELEKFLENL